MRHKACVLSIVVAIVVAIVAAPSVYADLQVRDGIPIGAASPLGQSEREEAVARAKRELRPTGKGTLHDVAVAAQGRYTFDEPIDTMYRGKATTLVDLDRSSDLVVVGTVTRQRVDLSSDGKRIFTYSDVLVSEFLRGHRMGELRVQMLGGVVTFPDGTSAEARTGGFRLEPGGRYLLFLTQVKSGDGSQFNAFRPTLGPQGVFDFGSEAFGVRLMARPADPIRGLSDGRDQAEFMQAVRVATAAHK